MMADVLQRSVTVCIEDEATSRGTAILALRALGVWRTLDAVPARLGKTYQPNPDRALVYQKGSRRQAELYDLVVGNRA